MSVRITDRSKEVSAALQVALAEGVAAAGLLIEGRAKEMCPVKTGNLRRSIHTQMEPQASPDSARALVGTSVDYAPHVEFGTYKQRAQPYLRPAYEEKKGEVAEVITGTVRLAIIASARG